MERKKRETERERGAHYKLRISGKERELYKAL